jgi:5-methyltetrahydrofolate--homocysteine methyltransferase
VKTALKHPLQQIMENRIAIIDGAMGTTIRTYGMTEAHIRGERFQDSTKDLLNNSGSGRGHYRNQHVRRDQHHAE